MIRTPLRPLARILQARQKGENPDRIERENIRQRHEDMRDRMRQRAESRLLFVGVFFMIAFVLVGGRMTELAATRRHCGPQWPRAGDQPDHQLALRAT